jgi:hypothetical protein
MNIRATSLGESVAGELIGGTASAVSWQAILAGATAAAALSLILLVLGVGLGLSAVSPWSGVGASAKAISWSAIIWIAFAAFASSGLGGYLAGRLRIRWRAVHTDEVYFRDTAHGFLAWAVATLLTAAVLSTVSGTVLGLGVTGGAAAATAERPGQGEVPSPYTIDSLFRAAPTAPAAANSKASGTTVVQARPDERDGKAEANHIFANSLRSGPLPAEDASYLGQLLMQRTGMTEQEAEARVNTTYASAQKRLQDAEARTKSLADEARKNGAYASLWVFVSLLLGAFTASLMATVGGRRRDLY